MLLSPAMVQLGRERLTGVVEVDESYWGTEEEGVIGRQIERKALIAVAVEERGAGWDGSACSASRMPRRPV